MRLPLVPQLSTKDGISNKNARLTNVLKESSSSGEKAVVRPGVNLLATTTGNGRGLVAFNNELVSVYGANLAVVTPPIDYTVIDPPFGTILFFNFASYSGDYLIGYVQDLNYDYEAVRYDAEDGIVQLGTLGGTSSFAYCSTSDGQTVFGGADLIGDTNTAFQWTLAGGMVDLGFAGTVTDCSSDGSVLIGNRNASPARAFRWTLVGGMVLIPLISPATRNYGNGVSADGSVVIGYDDAAGAGKAWKWTLADGSVGLGTLGGTSVATDISADGAVIVGYSIDSQGRSRAFRWTALGGMVSIDTYQGYSSRALSVSDDGTVIVGQLYYTASESANFRWTAETGMVRLDVGYEDGGYGVATAISGDGLVIVAEAYDVEKISGFMVDADISLIVALADNSFDFAQSTL